jgi:hypothetical protein
MTRLALWVEVVGATSLLIPAPTLAMDDVATAKKYLCMLAWSVDDFTISDALVAFPEMKHPVDDVEKALGRDLMDTIANMTRGMLRDKYEGVVPPYEEFKEFSDEIIASYMHRATDARFKEAMSSSATRGSFRKGGDVFGKRAFGR